MSKNIPEGDKDMNDIFAEFLSLDMYPNTLEEAEEIIQEAGIDISEFEKKTISIFRNILSESPLDWRNVSDDIIDAEAAKLDEIPLKKNLSKEQLIMSINRITKILESTIQGRQLNFELAHRNLETQTDDDLAQLLRQIEYAASELGIDIEDQ